MLEELLVARPTKVKLLKLLRTLKAGMKLSPLVTKNVSTGDKNCLQETFFVSTGDIFLRPCLYNQKNEPLPKK